MQIQKTGLTRGSSRNLLKLGCLDAPGGELVFVPDLALNRVKIKLFKLGHELFLGSLFIYMRKLG